jgi:polyketide synthase PksN
VGTVLLKPLSQAERDRDHIYAVIKGSAVFHGGKSNLSLISPSKNGQIEAMTRACRQAHINPSTIQYVEAHGTATSFGDPAEASALKKAFLNQTGGAVNGWRCGIGALKPNIGHLEAASGIASLIKLTMALREKKKPPLTGFHRLNPGIILEDSPFYIVRETEDWILSQHDQVRRAALNAYGFGGVNAHLILEEYVPPERKPTVAHEIITLSAKDAGALEQSAMNLLDHLKKHPQNLNLKDISYTLCQGRTPMPERLALIAADVDGLIDRLEHFRDNPACLHEQRSPQAGAEPKCAALASEKEGAPGHAHQLAQRWMNGEPVDWTPWFGDGTPFKVPLPTYRFNGKSYWFDQ